MDCAGKNKDIGFFQTVEHINEAIAPCVGAAIVITAADAAEAAAFDIDLVQVHHFRWFGKLSGKMTDHAVEVDVPFRRVGDNDHFALVGDGFGVDFARIILLNMVNQRRVQFGAGRFSLYRGEKPIEKIEQAAPFFLLEQIAHAGRKRIAEVHVQVIADSPHILMRRVVKKMNRGSQNGGVFALKHTLHISFKDEFNESFVL